jgi:hypothetical protein
MMKYILSATLLMGVLGCTTTVPVLQATPMVSCGDVEQAMVSPCEPLAGLALGATYEQALSTYASTKTAYGICQLKHKELIGYLMQCNKTIQKYNDNLPK